MNEPITQPDYSEFFNQFKIGDKMYVQLENNLCFVATYVQRTNTKNDSTIWVQRKSGDWTEVSPKNCRNPI